MNTVTILAFDDCHASSIACLTDALTLTNRLWQQSAGVSGRLFTWRVVSPDGRAVRMTGGMRLEVDGRLNGTDETTIIFIPGISFLNDGQLLQRTEVLWAACQAALVAQYARGAVLAASCSGTFLLARTGLLDRRQATTTWWLAQTFKTAYPRVVLQPKELVTQDERLYCAGAFTAYMNLTLRLIEEFGGPQLSLSCARMMLVDANHTAQSAYTTLQNQVAHTDDVVLKAQTWMQSSMANSFSLQDLADRLNISKRTLARRFKNALGESPVQYLQGMRVEMAKRLLETTVMNLEQIVEQVGYADVSSFRSLFERKTGLAPREYRIRFSVGRQ